MPELSWKHLPIPAILLGSALAYALSGHDGSDFDQRVPVGEGGTLTVDIVLGGGFSFDHGSLRVHSHETDDVRVRADSRGWGKWAVDLDLDHTGRDVVLAGVVEGTLHWLFGGPAVDVEVWVPRDFTLNTRFEGGPVVLEDLSGPITAKTPSGDLEVLGVEGAVRIESGDGEVHVENVDGELHVQNARGQVRVAGVQGAVAVTSERGSIELVSIRGPVSVESERGRVELDRVHGEVEVVAGRARIDAEDIEGSIVARTEHGSIDLEEVEGPVWARSGHGGIDIEFDGAPRGEIETKRGSIEVRVPDDEGFDLDARTERGEIEIHADADADEGRWGDQKRRRHDDWGWHDGDAPEDDPWHRDRGDDADTQRDAPGGDEDADGRRGPRALERFRGDEVVHAVNGGGPTLRLRTGRGSIQIHD